MPPRIRDPNLVTIPGTATTYDASKYTQNPKTGLFSQYIKPSQPTLSTGIWDLQPPLPISKRWDFALPEPYNPTPTPFSPQFDTEFYMTCAGRGAYEPRHVLKEPDLPDFEAAKGKREWVYTMGWVEEGDEYIENLPFAGGVGFRPLDGRKCFGKGTHESIVDLWHQADTYWIAISCAIYGDAAWWPWVKAQHLMYFQSVLNADGDTYDKYGWFPKHPRHDLYKRLNRQVRRIPDVNIDLFDIGYASTAKQDRRIPKPTIRNNISQQLVVQHQFVNHFMMQITADLYSIFLVLYLQQPDGTYNEGVVARGSYNARHIFLRLGNDLTYTALIPFPNPDKGTSPLLTHRISPINWSTAPTAIPAPPLKSTLASEATDPLFHPWRVDFAENGVPPALVPRTIPPIPTQRHLMRVAWLNITTDAKLAAVAKAEAEKRKRFSMIDRYGLRIPKDVKPYYRPTKRVHDVYVETPFGSELGVFMPDFKGFSRSEIQKAAKTLNVYWPLHYRIEPMPYDVIDKEMIPQLRAAFRAKRIQFWEDDRVAFEKRQTALDIVHMQDEIDAAVYKKRVADKKAAREKVYGGLSLEDVNKGNKAFVDGVMGGMNPVEQMAFGWILGKEMMEGVGSDDSWEKAAERAEKLEKFEKKTKGKYLPDEITKVQDLKKFFTAEIRIEAKNIYTAANLRHVQRFAKNNYLTGKVQGKGPNKLVIDVVGTHEQITAFKHDCEVRFKDAVFKRIDGRKYDPDDLPLTFALPKDEKLFPNSGELAMRTRHEIFSQKPHRFQTDTFATWARDTALAFGLTGLLTRIAGNAVSIEAQGPNNILDTFRKALVGSQMVGYVDSVDASIIEGEEGFSLPKEWSEELEDDDKMDVKEESPYGKEAEEVKAKADAEKAERDKIDKANKEAEVAKNKAEQDAKDADDTDMITELTDILKHPLSPDNLITAKTVERRTIKITGPNVREPNFALWIEGLAHRTRIRGFVAKTALVDGTLSPVLSGEIQGKLGDIVRFVNTFTPMGLNATISETLLQVKGEEGFEVSDERSFDNRGQNGSLDGAGAFLGSFGVGVFGNVKVEDQSGNKSESDDAVGLDGLETDLMDIDEFSDDPTISDDTIQRFSFRVKSARVLGAPFMKFISDKAKALSIMGWAQHHKEDDHVVVGKVQGQKKAIDELLPEIKNGGPPVARNMSAFEVSLVAGEAGFECRV